MASTPNPNPKQSFQGHRKWVGRVGKFLSNQRYRISSNFPFMGFPFTLGPTRCKILPMPLKLDYFFNGTVQTQSSLGNEIEQFKTAVRFLTVMGVTYLIFRLPAAVGNGQEVVKKLCGYSCQAVIRQQSHASILPIK